MESKFKKWLKNQRRIKKAKKDNTRRNIKALKSGHHTIGIIKDIYPCDTLILTVRYDQPQFQVIVDFSQYEEKSLIHYICDVTEEADFFMELCGKSEMASRVIKDAVVYSRIFTNVEGMIWNYAF